MLPGPFKFLFALVALAALSARARPVEITVLHTTDIHGHLLPTADYNGVTNVGGLLRCATKIEEIRRQKDNILLLDCGDLIQGSAESFLTDGRATIRAMEYLRYDAWTLGNHEFDWGLTKLLALHDETSLPMLAANITGRPGLPGPLTKVRPFILREYEGVKVAVVGLITPGVPSWSTPDLLGDNLFERSVQALKRVMPEVRAAQPDILLLATHQGYRPYGDDHANELNAVAAAFPEFDAIIGGHSHQPVERALIGGHALYTQAGYYGIWLGQLDLTYDTVTRKLVQKNTRLYRISEEVPMSTGLTAVVKTDIEKAQAYLDRPVGQAKGVIKHRGDEMGRSPVQQLICRAMAEVSGAEIVLHGILDEADLPSGPLKMSDVWKIVPYENRIAVLAVTPAELTDILNENLKRRGNIQFMAPFGFSYELDASGKSVARILLADGSTPHPRKRLKLAVNSYVVASGGQRFPMLREIAERPETRLQLLEVDTRSSVIRYLEKHRPLDPVSLEVGKP